MRIRGAFWALSYIPTTARHVTVRLTAASVASSGREFPVGVVVLNPFRPESLANQVVNAARRLERLESALDYARHECDNAAVVVEGKRDVTALQTLAVGAKHVLVNQRGTLEDLVDSLAQSGQQVVLLLDWDRTGDRLARRLHDGLVGQIPVDSEVRRRLAVACHCKCVEDIPAELVGLRVKTGIKG
jgi:5S rRNA maturation endonuclease (ribonuclease M5)